MSEVPPPLLATVDARRGTPSSRDRGVSEVVSFILTFSIITMMVGLLYTAGFVSMERLQTGNQMQTAEGVFFAMADSFGELQEGQAPRRAGALDLDVGASLSVNDGSQFSVAVNNATDTMFTRTIVTRSLDYRLDERVVSYETGAVFRANGDDSAIVRDPAGMFCSPSTNSAMVSLVTIVDPEGASIASGTATVSGRQRSTTLLFPDSRNGTTSTENVTVNVTSPYADAWNEYLTDETEWEDPDGDGTFACEGVDQVFVRHTVIEVRANA